MPTVWGDETRLCNGERLRTASFVERGWISKSGFKDLYFWENRPKDLRANILLAMYKGCGKSHTSFSPPNKYTPHRLVPTGSLMQVPPSLAVLFGSRVPPPHPTAAAATVRGARGSSGESPSVLLKSELSRGPESYMRPNYPWSMTNYRVYDLPDDRIKQI